MGENLFFKGNVIFRKFPRDGKYTTFLVFVVFLDDYLVPLCNLKRV